MSNHLLKQAERICDEVEARKFSVIIQTQNDDKDTREVIKAAREALERRNQTISARDLMPPVASVLNKEKITAPVKRKLAVSGQSIASSIAMTSVSSRKMKDLESAGIESIETVLSIASVRKLIEPSGVKKDKSDLVSFWTSGSIVLDVKKKDDLISLAKDSDSVKGISDIFPNRRIETPSQPDVRNLPGEVKKMENEVSTWGLQKTNALASWGTFNAKGQGVNVAVLDTGVDAKHSALSGSVVRFAEFDHRGNTIKDGDASMAYDSGKHGTHCCGTVAGGKAKRIFIGMAPEAKIFAGLVLKGGSGTDAQILAGMQWAIQNRADVISMSLGGLRMTPDVMDTYSRTIITANRLGIPVVVAMGNDGHQTSGAPGNDYFAFGVGATDVQDRAAGFSGGRTQIIERSRFIDSRYLPLVYRKPDVSAPGVAVYSCIPSEKYASWNGTSMATPHVAGAIAQLLSATTIQNVDKSKRAYLIQDIVTSTVDELGESGQDQRYGYGRIDVLRAIGYAKYLGYDNES